MVQVFPFHFGVSTLLFAPVSNRRGHFLLYVLRNGREGMIAVHLVSCDGHAIYKECVYKQEPFCEPVKELLESWAAYRDQRTNAQVIGPIFVLTLSRLPSGMARRRRRDLTSQPRCFTCTCAGFAHVRVIPSRV